MEARKARSRIIISSSSARSHRSGRSRRRVIGGLRGLGLVGTMLFTKTAVAQHRENLQLTVQPHAMAAGTQNPQTGEYSLDAAPRDLVYVPPSCEGARPCPLAVLLTWLGAPSSQLMDWVRPMANQYGIILLVSTPSQWNVAPLDAALTETVQRFAIDPGKIALIGRRGSGEFGMRVGLANADVFGRVVSISARIPLVSTSPGNKKPECLLVRGYLEGSGLFEAARDLRHKGYPVATFLSLRRAELQMEEYDYIGHWLHKTWTTPIPEARVASEVVADPLPILTAETLAMMTTFWTDFLQEADSIRTTARQAHLREVMISVGEERPSVWMVDMPALAAKYPSVAAKLKRAGLTAQQHEAYRVALISAQVARSAGSGVGNLPATSALALNLAFLNAHLGEFAALAAAGVEQPDQLRQDQWMFGSPDVTPEQMAEFGAMGIWRTP